MEICFYHKRETAQGKLSLIKNLIHLFILPFKLNLQFKFTLQKLFSGSTLTAIVFALMIVAPLVLVSCGNDDDDKPVEQPYQYWSEIDINFYQGEGVSEQEIKDIIAMLKLNVDIPFLIEKWTAKIDKIYVTANDTEVKLVGKTLYVGHNADCYVKNQQNNAIMLAAAFQLAVMSEEFMTAATTYQSQAIAFNTEAKASMTKAAAFKP